jgi:general L-amino acid transport system permease protein
MTMAASTPKESFRFSMLIYDTRFRSYTIQIIVLILFIAALGWLVNNTVENLAAKDRTFDFGFLFNRAGYDINPHLIDYTNDDSHGRALLVGLLNTLSVAALGCVFATMLGVVAGVLRLSSNWLVARLMTVYVEITRNVPVLLWIIVMYVALAETTSAPNAFKITPEMVRDGTQPEATMHLWNSIAVTNREISIPEPLFSRPLGDISLYFFNVSIELLALVAVIAASVMTSRWIVRRATRIQEETGIRPSTWYLRLGVLLVPTLMLLVALGFHIGKPSMWKTDANGAYILVDKSGNELVDANGLALPDAEGSRITSGFNFRGGIQITHAFTALLVGLVFYTGAYIAEIVRAGIQAVSKGQSEASYALGMSPKRTMNLVILPQALRVIIPPLISQYLNLTKNTSLAAAVSFMDLKGTLGGITMNQTGKELESMLLMMGIYLTLSLLISSVMNVYNKAVALKER